MIPIKISDDPRTAVDFFSYMMYDSQDKNVSQASKLILNIKPEWLFNNIKSINDLAYDKSSSVLLWDGQGHLYSEENTTAEFLPVGLVERIKSSTAEFETFTFGKGRGKSIVTVMSLGVYHWKAISIQSYAFAFSPLISIRNMLIVSTVLFLVLSVFIAFLISQRL